MTTPAKDIEEEEPQVLCLAESCENEADFEIWCGFTRGDVGYSCLLHLPLVIPVHAPRLLLINLHMVTSDDSLEAMLWTHPRGFLKHDQRLKQLHRDKETS